MNTSTDPMPPEARPHVFPSECDLVMKGGITSGIVYPLAVVEIAKAFRLRSIGGTSAGAIAAAAAAAAELGRQRVLNSKLSGSEDDPFTELADLPRLLSQPSPSGAPTQLLAFFRPHPSLRPVFNAFIKAVDSKWPIAAALTSLALHHWFVALVALAIGALPLWFIAPSGWGILAILLVILLAIALSVTSVIVVTLRRLSQDLPANNYGACSGMPAENEKFGNECLTPWFHSFYNQLSRQTDAQSTAADPIERTKPVTFGDLKDAGIDLQMITTCLTLGRPFRLPFRDDEQVRENRQFWYNEAEFRRLFPKDVVDWMVAREVVKGNKGGALDNVDFTGFRSLPSPQDLPVIVAVRLSLSFPLLLSAVPLYSFDFRKPVVKGQRPERCWFTDGGVGSNFPIHFFDSPLPTRPTFGLDLGEREEEESGGGRDEDESRAVVFPKTNADARLAYWRRFDHGGFQGIAGFLGTIVTVAKEWNHETLTHMPGYRDRIGLILLTKKQGGLNLTMSKKLIDQLTGYGRQAGLEFVRRFGNSEVSHDVEPAATMNWENHQLVRLRLFLAAITETLGALSHSREQAAADGYGYERFFFAGNYGPKSYRFEGLLDPVESDGSKTVTQARLAKVVLDELDEIAKDVHDAAEKSQTSRHEPPTSAPVHPARRAPKPTPEFRLRPRV